VGNANSILGISTASPDNHYTISFVAGNISGPCSGGGASFACGYTVVATPVGGQSANGKLRIDGAGIKQWDKNNNNSYTYKWTDK
jgi:hypothetical protein